MKQHYYFKPNPAGAVAREFPFSGFTSEGNGGDAVGEGDRLFVKTGVLEQGTGHRTCWMRSLVQCETDSNTQAFEDLHISWKLKGVSGNGTYIKYHKPFYDKMNWMMEQGVFARVSKESSGQWNKIAEWTKQLAEEDHDWERLTDAVDDIRTPAVQPSDLTCNCFTDGLPDWTREPATSAGVRLRVDAGLYVNTEFFLDGVNGYISFQQQMEARIEVIDLKLLLVVHGQDDRETPARNR